MERGGKNSPRDVEGGGGRTYRKRYLISDRIRCCQATNDEKTRLEVVSLHQLPFPYCNLRENFMADIWSQRFMLFPWKYWGIEPL